MKHTTLVSGWLVILATSVSVAVSPASHWCESFHQEDLDTYGMDIEAISDGGFIIAGNADFTPQSASPLFAAISSQLFLITKLSDDGTPQWQRTYSFTESMEQKATGVVEVLSENRFGEGRRGFVVAGYARIRRSQAAVVMKLDANGDVEWHRVYFSDYYNVIPGAITYDNGTVAIAGAIEPLNGVPQEILADLGGPMDRDVWVMELDLADPNNEGDLLWQKAFDFQNQEMEAAVAIIFDGGDVVVGSNMLDTQGQYDISILKLDAAGNEVGAAKLGDPANAVHDQITSIAIAENGNYVLTGITQDPVIGGRWWKVLALELHMPPTGKNSCLWMNSYELSEKSSLSYAVEATPFNQYAVSGSVYSSSGSVRNGLLLVLDSAGNMSQALQYGGKLDDAFYDLDVFEVESAVEGRPDYAMATTGFTRSFPDNGTENLWAMSLDRFGRPDHPDGCLISLPSVMIQNALAWACHCGHPDRSTTTPILEQMEVDIQVEDFRSHPGIICVDLF